MVIFRSGGDAEELVKGIGRGRREEVGERLGECGVLEFK